MADTTTTKKDPRKRGFCFVLNNPTEEQLDHYMTLSESKDITRMIVGLEVAPTTGTKHFQGYLEFKNAKTWTASMKWFGGRENVDDLQIREGTPFQAWNYCTKGEVFISVGDIPEEIVQKKSEGHWEEIVQPVKDGKTWLEIVDIKPNIAVQMGSAIQRYMLEYQRNTMDDWRPVQVTYVQGTTGSGKTHAVMRAMGGMKDVYRVTNYANPFDGYNGQRTIIFEEFRSSLPLTEMLVFLENWVTPLKCRYSDRMSQYTRVFVISNMNLSSQYSKFQKKIEWEEDDELREGMQRSLDAFYRRFELCDGMWNDLGMDGLDIVTITNRQESQTFYHRLIEEVKIRDGVEFSQEEE